MILMTLEVAGRTHTGLVRRRNEDALYLGRHLVAVADGLGGHVAGDVASRVVIEAVRTFDQVVAPTELPDMLGRAVAAANTELRRRIAAEPELAGMGSTLVALMWSGSTATLANIGDSRAYLLRGGRLLQITEDHTYGNLLAAAGRVPTLPDRLARFLDGRADGRSADITTHQLHAGDRLLLCSDGLSSFVPNGVIHATVSSTAVVTDATDRLVDLALEQGGHDNITAIMVHVRDEPHPHARSGD